MEDFVPGEVTVTLGADGGIGVRLSETDRAVEVLRAAARRITRGSPLAGSPRQSARWRMRCPTSANQHDSGQTGEHQRGPPRRPACSDSTATRFSLNAVL